MTNNPVVAENEYEYEYDDNETETFLVDLDVSSLNTAIKSSIAVTAKGKKKPKPRSRKVDQNTKTPTPDPDPDPDPEPDEPQNPHGTASPGSAQQTPVNDDVREQNDVQTTIPVSFQALGLHSTNPIISYQDQVYSCTWVDMIGTNMFFTQPGASEDIQPALSTDDCDLLGVSTIKLLGHRTIMKKNPKKRARAEDDEEGHLAGRSLGELTHNSAAKNVQIKNQATFLEKLMDIKSQRGHQDMVRTYVDEKTAAKESPQFSQAQSIEIDELNRRVVRGDGAALERLQKIYSQLEEDDGDHGNNAAMEPSHEVGEVGPSPTENMQAV
ncbi:hypothetical protein LTR84_003915 [Exophiala bonariae]|uniref:Transcription factor TFIIIC triple barrel domain-containing protein n=1 Tax=Exophiala bonariae TaxID=1690606 RepID=A0AAV9N6U5_9EURO|nr:hypothetical protein LTR84_003915 [Exophiala bonariae]